MSELDRQRILALNVHPRSFGFVVFEGPAMPLGWGAKRNHRPNVSVRMPLGPKVSELMAEYSPQIIVIRQPKTKQSRESLDDIVSHLEIHKVRIKILSLEEVKQAFPGHNNNKDQIASAIVEQIPELLSILPPRR